MEAQILAVAPGPAGLSEGRGFIEQALTAAGFDAESRYQVTVATNEAVSNAMEHGAPCADGHFHLAAAVESDTFVFSVRDCGEFDDAASAEPDPVAERGRGFAFMNLLMDDVRLDARPGETVLRLAKRLPDAPAPAGDEAPATTEANTATVRRLFEAFARRDVDLLSEIADRGVMMEPLSTPVVRRTPYLGISGLRLYLQDLEATWEQFDVSIEGMQAAGDHVAAFGRIYARGQDHVADDPAGFTFKLRDGKIVWAKVYASHDEARAAAGL